MVRNANGWIRVGLVVLVVAGLSGCASVVAAGPASASGTITQVGQTSGTVYDGGAFTFQLETTGNVGPVSFSTYSPICGSSRSAVGRYLTGDPPIGIHQ